MMNSLNTTAMDRMPTIDLMRAQMDILDSAGKMLEKYLAMDSSFPSLVDVTQIAPQGSYFSILGKLRYISSYFSRLLS